MKNKLNNLIENHSENKLLDFKIEQYLLGKKSKKHELLKDISAMANCLSNEDKFIIIGVKEVNGKADDFSNVEELIDDAKYQDYLIGNITPLINFEYNSHIYKGHKLAYFRIYDNHDRPYLLKKDVKNASNDKNAFRVGDGFKRIGTNTKKLDRIDFDNIYKSKNEMTDRSDDLEIITKHHKIMDAEISTSENYKNDEYFLIDFQIFNNSPKKISVFYQLIIEDLNQLFITKHRIKELINLGKFMFHSSSRHSKLEELKVFKYENKKIISRKDNIETTIGPNSVSDNLFCNEVIIEKSNLKNIKVKLILNGDDFKNGQFIKEINLNEAKAWY